MATHSIEPDDLTLHSSFSRDLPPILTITSGDTVRFRTIDAGWNVYDHDDPFERPPKHPAHSREREAGHALCGPIAIEGARAGMTLAIHLKTIRPGPWGWSMGGGFPSAINKRLGIADGKDVYLGWRLDNDAGTATNRFGHTLRTRPFMGIMGMPPAEPGHHSTVPPRFCGGNIDCTELIAGSTLYLPIAVDGGLFSLGDGHAVMGDGEVAGPALECPMECVEVELELLPDLHLTMPRARTERGWITFGFHEDLDEAAMIALEGMLALMQEQHGFQLKEALALASCVVDVRISQIVNGVKGIHAILPHNAFQLSG